jgi:hypothetical protein
MIQIIIYQCLIPAHSTYCADLRQRNTRQQLCANVANTDNGKIRFSNTRPKRFELELELTQAHMTQKPMLRVEVGARVCAQVKICEVVLAKRGVINQDYPAHQLAGKVPRYHTKAAHTDRKLSTTSHNTESTCKHPTPTPRTCSTYNHPNSSNFNSSWLLAGLPLKSGGVGQARCSIRLLY